ncbi:MAG: histidinol dehydrogenase [Thaumarchaeota archaeon]|nr:histidinol dehydrogenase [Nitrososphaerota archaeon]
MPAVYLKSAQPRKQEDAAPVRNLVAEVLERVRTEGEAAVRFYSEKFDKWNPPSFRLSEAEIKELIDQVPEGLKKDIQFLNEQVRRFAEAQKKTLTDFEVETLPGVTLGQRYLAVDSVGVYIPGGRYALIASSQMSIVPARVAGVRRVIACTPTQRGKLNPAVVYAIHIAGADEIYTIGGAQAIGFMAYGVEGTRPVDLIAGPGNKFVVEAKRQVFGSVGIDLVAGPTEIGIIADETADAELVAADIVAQAEHDPDSPQFVITTSRQMGSKVIAAIEEQLLDLPTAEVAREAWTRNGEVILVASKEEAASVADSYAPEHLQLETGEDGWFFENLKSYGTLAIGEEATVVYSDKAIGTNHILPTGRAARYTGGLWVGKYMKNVTWQRLTKEGSLRIAPPASRISRAEGMVAHERSALARIKRYGSKDQAIVRPPSM